LIQALMKLKKGIYIESYKKLKRLVV